MVLIYLFEIISDVKHLFICLWAFVCGLWRNIYKVWCWHFNWIINFLLLSCRSSYIFWKLTPSQIFGLQLICCAQVFQFDVVLLVYFCFCNICFSCHIHEIIVKTDVNRLYFYVFFFPRNIIFSSIFRPCIKIFYLFGADFCDYIV